MKTPQERFEENYRAVQVPAQNRKGFRIRYEYYGPWFRWNEPPARMRREKLLAGAACVLGAVCFLCAAATNVSLNYAALVGVPANCSMAAFLFKAIGVVQFCAAKEKMTRPSWQEIRTKVLAAGAIEAALLAFAAAAGFVLAAVRGLAAAQLFVPAGYLLSAACTAFLFVRFRALHVTSEPNPLAAPAEKQENPFLQP